jgi:hypothetical protein
MDQLGFRWPELDDALCCGSRIGRAALLAVRRSQRGLLEVVRLAGIEPTTLGFGGHANRSLFPSEYFRRQRRHSEFSGFTSSCLAFPIRIHSS